MFNPNEPLFQEFSLDEILRQSFLNLDSRIKSLSLKEISDRGEDVIASDLISEYKLEPVVLDEERVEVAPREATITLNRHFRGFDMDEDGPIRVKGLAITVRIPFTGNEELFKARASTYTLSGTPRGRTEANRLVLYYETAEKDPEKIKKLWESDISSIKQNLSWIERDLATHNNSLESNIRTGLARRKKEAGEYDSLISKLKK